MSEIKCQSDSMSEHVLRWGFLEESDLTKTESKFLNFDMALTSSFFACLLAVLCLLLRAGSLTGIAEQPLWLLNTSIMAWPLLVFLVVYFLGHLWDSRCFWFDRICVDQKNASLKLQTIQAIPGFVAQSKKMLVLWDDTYFERLWCSFPKSESTFLVTFVGQNMHAGHDYI